MKLKNKNVNRRKKNDKASTELKKRKEQRK